MNYDIEEDISKIGDMVMYIGNIENVTPFTKKFMKNTLIKYKSYTIKEIHSYVLIIGRMVPCYMFYEINDFWFPYICFLNVKSKYGLR